MTDFVLFQLILLASLFTIQYCTGLLVRYKGIKVNYTRKINHFALFFVPLFLRSIFPYEGSLERFIVGCVLGTLLLFIYIKPIRDKISIIATMFLSFDAVSCFTERDFFSGSERHN
jgi:phytol kinase